MGNGLVATATAWLRRDGDLVLSWEREAISGRTDTLGLCSRSWTPSVGSHVPPKQLFVRTLSVYLLLALLPLALADCECGYAAEVGGGSTGSRRYLFTDLIETNFLHVDDIEATAWKPQNFSISSAAARGDYGEMFNIENVVTNPGGQGNSHVGAEGGNTPGLQLVVKKDVVEGMVPTAELATTRLDLSWGTFRASMKMSSIPGTCAAFFWYFNDTQEIDMEFLSKDFNPNNNSYPVNLVLQSSAAQKTHNAALTGNFIEAYLPFNPTTDFHEYRIDYIPGEVFFYADGVLLGQINGSAVPTTPGHLILQHWSNGNALWSGGPPARDAVLTVEYVKAYFNSSERQRFEDWKGRCKDLEGEHAVCAIPEVTPKNPSASEWFFSQHKNMTNNQTVYGQNKGSLLSAELTWWPVIVVVLFMTSGWTTGLW